MIIAKFYPNGEFTQGVDTSRSRKKTSTLVPPPPPPPSKPTIDGYMQWAKDNADIAQHLCTEGNIFSNGKGIYTFLCQDTQGYHYAYEGRTYVLEDVVFLYPPGYMIALGLWVYQPSPLVHQTVESSPGCQNGSQSSRKQVKSMTKNMARNIRNGVFLLEKTKHKANLSFLTLTIPTLLPENHASVLRSWAKMTDSILKWLRKHLAKKGIILQYVYCTEIQPKRYERTGYLAPHLHIVFVGRAGNKHPWAITPKAVRKAWARIIAGVLPTDEKFETGALENLQRIKQSAARYLSKYMSKGSCSIARSDSNGQSSLLHTQWGGMDRQTARDIKIYTIRLGTDGALREIVVSFTNSLEQLFNAGLLKYFKRGQVYIGTYPGTNIQRFLHVSCGCLSTPTIHGGLGELITYLQRHPAHEH